MKLIPYVIAGVGVFTLTFVERGGMEWAWMSQWQYWIGVTFVWLALSLARAMK